MIVWTDSLAHILLHTRYKVINIALILITIDYDIVETIYIGPFYIQINIICVSKKVEVAFCIEIT